MIVSLAMRLTLKKRDIGTGLHSPRSSTTMMLSTTRSQTSVLLVLPYLSLRKLLGIVLMVISKGKVLRTKDKILLTKLTEDRDMKKKSDFFSVLQSRTGGWHIYAGFWVADT